jgi:hypothetical protein
MFWAVIWFFLFRFVPRKFANSIITRLSHRHQRLDAAKLHGNLSSTLRMKVAATLIGGAQGM